MPLKVRAVTDALYCAKIKLVWGKNFKSHKCGVP
jgi:hypothetical protein